MHDEVPTHQLQRSFKPFTPLCEECGEELCDPRSPIHCGKPWAGRERVNTGGYIFLPGALNIASGTVGIMQLHPQRPMVPPYYLAIWPFLDVSIESMQMGQEHIGVALGAAHPSAFMLPRRHDCPPSLVPFDGPALHLGNTVRLQILNRSVISQECFVALWGCLGSGRFVPRDPLPSPHVEQIIQLDEHVRKLNARVSELFDRNQFLEQQARDIDAERDRLREAALTFECADMSPGEAKRKPSACLDYLTGRAAERRNADRRATEQLLSERAASNEGDAWQTPCDES